MNTIFCHNNITGKLYKWNHNVLMLPNIKPVKVGDPLLIEYKRAKIVSNKFDLIGKSEIMITTNIKEDGQCDIVRRVSDNDMTTKGEQDIILYYDKAVKPESYYDERICKYIYYHIIDNFEDHGHAICYYNPGFNNNIINLVTKFWEVDDPKFIYKILRYIKKLLFTVKITKLSPTLNITGTIINNCGYLLATLIENKKMTKEHVIEFRSDKYDKPLILGNYLCLPNIDTVCEVDNITENYHFDSGILLNNNTKIEYDDTYFVISVLDTKSDPSYDSANYYGHKFVTNINRIINNINKEPNGLLCLPNEDKIKEVVEMYKESTDFMTIKKIIKYEESKRMTNYEELLVIKSMYNHLSDDNKLWFEKYFYDMYTKFKHL